MVRKKKRKFKTPAKRKKRRLKSSSQPGVRKRLKSWAKKKARPFTKNRFQWFLFLGIIVIGGLFFLFHDYRQEAKEFETVLRASVQNISQAQVIRRSSVPKENWRAKWNEVRLKIRVTSGASLSDTWKRIQKKVPTKFQLYREVVSETGTAHGIKAEYRYRGVPIAFVEVTLKKKSVSTEFLAKEKETVKPKRFFSLPQPKPKAKPKPKKPAPVPVSKKKPRVVLVIDDVGNSNKLFSSLFSLPARITIAVLPSLPFTREAGRLGKQKGFEVILHQPVEALHHNDTLGPGGIFTGQNSTEISGVVRENLNALPGVSGSNNHMGSKGTSNLKLMKAYLNELKKKNLFFLDSWTTRYTVGGDAARVLGVPYLKRNVFLDNKDEPEAIRKQVRELMSVAKKNGVAIGIGHIRPHTINVLREMIPEIRGEGIQVVQLKDVL